VELRDFLAITKSCLASAVYLIEMTRNEANESNFIMKTKQFDVTLTGVKEKGERSPISVDIGSIYDMIRIVIETQVRNFCKFMNCFSGVR
jgi:hypothetical protein